MEKQIPIGLLAIFTIKAMIFGADFAAMGIIVGLGLVSVVNNYFDTQKKFKDFKDTCDIEIADFKQVIKAQNEVLEKMARTVDEQRTVTTSLKMAQGMRKVSGV